LGRIAVPQEILVENLHKSFGDNHVLRGVNLSIQRGEIVAIVGRSGSGKTVLLQHLIGFLTPDQGRVMLADHESAGSPLVDLATLDEEGMDRLRIHWGVVFQQNALTSGTVEENIALPLQWVQGLSDAQIHQRASEALRAVGLNPDEVLRIYRDDLSGGMAKRVAIARALALNPLLLFFDEPTTGLDPENATLIQNLVYQTYQRETDGFKCTTVIITHDKDLLYRLEPRTVMMHDGGVFFDGTYQSFAQSDSPVVLPYFQQMPVLHKGGNT
jgi:phospholipid/cholesterol/gamma-HCH transport system ATP-binding protein